ncbi:hypothetical protein BH23ACT3_BH23ACT3_17440 [soil metagenome]
MFSGAALRWAPTRMLIGRFGMTPVGYGWDMIAILVILFILALVFGGIGLLVEGLLWLLIIALVLVVVGAVVGFSGRGRSRA